MFYYFLDLTQPEIAAFPSSKHFMATHFLLNQNIFASSVIMYFKRGKYNHILTSKKVNMYIFMWTHQQVADSIQNDLIYKSNFRPREVLVDCCTIGCTGHACICSIYVMLHPNETQLPGKKILDFSQSTSY